MHHSILSEGMNVKGLEAVFFMRNMDYIGISQSIGRVIRTVDQFGDEYWWREQNLWSSLYSRV